MPTRIMYSTNLSWLSLNQVMKQLVSNDLLEEINDESSDRRTKTTYRVTEKGERFMEYLGHAIKSVKLDEIEV